MRFKGKGHIKGDLIIKVGVKKHAQFKREGNDSLIEKEINIIEAVLGAEVNV
jgi:DnaJ-class molecular chaperone